MIANAPKPVARAIQLIFALQGQSFEGLRLTQLANGVRQSASATLRDLQGLESLGIVERVPGRDDCWRLSPRIVQVAIAHAAEVQRAQQRVHEFEQRYSRSPN